MPDHDHAHDHDHDHGHDHSGHSHDHDLDAEAKEHVEAMPAETALGHADPAGGGEGTPADYVKEHEGKGGK